MRTKFLLFVLGILTIVVGLIGLAFSFNFVPAFLIVLPEDPRIYFGLTVILGIISLIYSFSKTLM